MPTRHDVADQLRALIDGKKTREEVSAWATQYVVDDEVRITDKVTWRAIKTLVGADARADLDNYVYADIDFRKWLDDVLND